MFRVSICVFLFVLSCSYAQFNLDCTTNEDCNQVTGSICSNQKCQCQQIDETFSSDMTKCLRVSTGISSSCEDSLQCSSWLLVGSECHADLKQCSCVKGFHYRNGRCRKSSGLNEKCFDDDDCYNGYDIEALSCKAGICQCNSDPVTMYYDRLKMDCRRIAKGVGDPCVVDVDCQFPNGVCTKNMSCGTNETTSNFELILPNDIPSRIKRAKDPVLGSSCTEDKNCANVKNSFCFGTCRCKKGFSTDIKNDICTVEMGQETDNENDCELFRNSEYRDGKCLCKIGFFYSPTNSECIKPTRALNNSCTSDLNCKTFGNEAVCSSKRCKCKENTWFDELNSICRIRKNIGEICADDDDCFQTVTEGSVTPKCEDFLCTCPSGSYNPKNEEYCQLEKVGIGARCKKREECVVPNSKCLDKICSCENKFYYDETNNACLAGIGHECTVNEDCSVEFSTCKMNAKDKLVCQCEDGFIDNNHICYKELESIQDSCVSDFQCHLKFQNSSSCVDNTCKCNDGFHFRNNKCNPLKYLENVCTGDGECFVTKNMDEVECRNSQCLCKFGYKIAADRMYCEKNNGMAVPSLKHLSSILAVILIWVAKYQI